MTEREHDPLVVAARTCAHLGLVDAFGHLSRRIGGDRFEITPPQALGGLADDVGLNRVRLADDALPDGVPGEAWIHWAIYRRRPDVEAICRAQPFHTHPFGAVSAELPALHGQGAWVSPVVPVHPVATLVRDRAAGESVADSLGGHGAVILRGNGAVVVGSDPWEVTTRMWLLDRSCRVALDALSAGEARRLEPAECDAWRAAAPELLPRLWGFLSASR